jgi:uncharacterized repeat protein (TIGR03987 family)
MNAQLMLAVVLITAALVFYSIGVWSEFAGRTLRARHAVFLGLGLACDSSATWLMSQLPADSSTSPLGSSLIVIMAVSGTLAIVLMAVHLLAAIVVLVRKRENELHRFHRFSIVVWAIWLIPYTTGLLGGAVVPNLT